MNARVVICGWRFASRARRPSPFRLRRSANPAARFRVSVRCFRPRPKLSDHAACALNAQFHTREPVSSRRRTQRDSHHVRPRLGYVSRFHVHVFRVGRITARRDPARPRRGAPRDACRRRQLRFSRAFEVRVAGRGGRRGSLLASPRVPLTTVPPLRAAPHFALPKPQTTRSSRSPTSPPRPRRRRRSRPIPASRTKTRRSRR